MRLAAWRILIWSGIAFSLYFAAGTLVTALQPAGEYGYQLKYLGGTVPTFEVLDVRPDSPASRAGLEPHDRLRPAVNDPAHRFAWLQTLPGDRAGWVAVHAGRERTISIVAVPHATGETASLALVYAIIQLALTVGAAVLVVRAADNPAARLLAGFFVALSLGVLGPSAQATPRPIFAAAIVLQDGLIYVAAWQCLAFACIFPSMSVRGMRPSLLRITPGLSVLLAGVATAATFSLYLYGTTLPPQWFTLMSDSWLAYVALIALAFAIAYREAAAEDRQRVRWVAASFLFGLSGLAVLNVALRLFGYAETWTNCLPLTVVTIPLGTGYAILRHRVIDIGFVINRALVYGGVSAVIVVTMGILEWVLEKTVVEVNHVTSVSLEVALALALGYFLRRIHGRIDKIVDYLFFRDLHRAEAALREFARDAHYITDLSTLLERTARIAVDAGEATFAGVWMADEAGGFAIVRGSGSLAERVDENDPVVVRLKATRDPVRMRDLGTPLGGEFALPMVVRGALTGFIVAGPKVDGEDYSPDEIATLANMAHEVGLAIEALHVELLRREVDRVLNGGGSLDELRSVARFAMPALARFETDEAGTAS